MNKIYLFLADGFETVEALAPVDVMRRAGLDVTTVSIMGRRDVLSAQGVSVLADALLQECSLADADAFPVEEVEPRISRLVNLYAWKLHVPITGVSSLLPSVQHLWCLAVWVYWRAERLPVIRDARPTLARAIPLRQLRKMVI